ncbi:MAG: FecR family protein [Chitinophagaceae bacterium]|nr:FecR family protein [Chitinophagaceae bacterium]
MNNHIELLFKKYIANDCTSVEAAELIDIIRSGNQKELIESLMQEQLGNAATDELLFKAASDRVFKRLDLSNTEEQVLPIGARRLPTYIKVAAAIIVIAVSSVAMYFLFSSGKKTTPVMVAMQDIAPGGNKATLVLSDGKQVVLNDIGVGNITEDGGAIIKKSADGQLAYYSTDNSQNHKAINTVKTPMGGQYQVVLPDGSKVRLNAASSITYPAAFNSDERRVTLTGEAYFEITHLTKNNRKVPFIVETGRQKIEVLGTRFNVNAYDDEKGITTTLVEGKVKVTTENETVILKPNQELNLRDEGITTHKVDVETVIDWTNGDFNFADEDMKSVMRKIARWYNVEVVYDSNIPDVNLSAQISRDRNLSEVLRMLELSGDAQFRIENGAIHISNKTK